MVHSNNVVKTKEIIGVKVFNTRMEKLGEIEEIVLDKATGKVAYVVLASGSFLGMNGKLFAIPWHLIHYNNIGNCFILDISKEKIKTIAGFDKDNWPDTADITFAKSYSEYETIA